MDISQAQTRAKELRGQGKKLAEIAESLMSEGYRGSRGGTKLTPTQVSKFFSGNSKRINAANKASKLAKAPIIAPISEASTKADPLKLVRSVLKLKLDADDKIALALAVVG